MAAKNKSCLVNSTSNYTNGNTTKKASVTKNSKSIWMWSRALKLQEKPWPLLSRLKYGRLQVISLRANSLSVERNKMLIAHWFF